jgi:hypothetical protein
MRVADIGALAHGSANSLHFSKDLNFFIQNSLFIFELRFIRVSLSINIDQTGRFGGQRLG